jgi:GNAT superfamily N-acetyltransferase
MNKAPNAGRESVVMIVAVHRARHDSDFLDLYRLFVDYEAALPHDLRHGAVPDATSLKDAYGDENAAFLAAIESEAIGCVGVTMLDTQTARMRHLFVQPAHRGLGAARSLVAASIDFVREQGCRRYVLDTHKGILRPAYELYRSFGFEECAPNVSVSYACPTFMELFLSRRSDLNR